MSAPQNKFSWSFSAARDFDECRRRRYWSKYAMWSGWQEDASETQKAAYRLGKMENRHTLQGEAVEEAVMWVLRKHQHGKAVTADEAYNTAARPLLNEAWRQSKQGEWKLNPKNKCCLWEHYYGRYSQAEGRQMTESMIAHTKTCIANFINSVLPRLEGVAPSQEIRVRTVRDGDPESFPFDGVKIYAIPDYVYTKDGHTHIHDWKAGKPHESHEGQVCLYGLWANTTHKIGPPDITVHLEYLATGAVQSKKLSEQDIEKVKSQIRTSVADMSEYLVDGDKSRNQPLPMEDWELAEKPGTCRHCNFLELCKPEENG